MSDHDDELWQCYAIDATDALSEIEEALLALERAPADAEQINRLYRGLHTLKGNSAILGLERVQRLAHAAEDLAALVRDRGVPFDDALAQAMLQVVDVLRVVVQQVGASHADVAEDAVRDAVALLRRTAAGYALPEAEMLRAPPEGYVIWPEREHAPTADLDAFLRLDAAQTVAANLPPTPAPAEPPPAPTPRAAPREGAADFLRVDARKVALLMDLAGEVGLAVGAVAHHPDLEGCDLAGFSNAAHNLEVLIRELQNEVSSLRLVPIAGVFERMRRVVRDTARRTGKRVELSFVGEDTEIDKMMLDSLHDPLVHVLRNAIDHGIEAPEARAAAGKSPVGRVVLEASHQGGEVSIRVTDDGAGIDRARVVAKARERGLIAEDAQPTDDEALALIFLPGFSTRDEVSEVSGRGVGMDVIRTNIEDLRGRVHLQSTLGRGSRVSMTLPLTMAFVDAMVVRAQDQLFALPMEKVYEVFRAEPARVARNSADGRTLLRVRDALVPVLWLCEFYGQPCGDDLRDQVVVVVQTSRGELALPVDHLLGNQQVMLKPLRGMLRGVRAAAGYGMLRSGDVAITLDCERLHA